MLGLDGILRASSSRIGPRASVRSSRLTTIGLSRRFLAGSNAAADNHRIGNARSSFHGGLSRTRVRLPPPPPSYPLNSPLAERILPAPDIFATCPPDGRILEYYVGTFEAVFVLLHPFIKAVSMGIDQFNPATYPGRSTIVEKCAPVSWAEVASKAALPSIAAVDVGLRTRILGLKAELSNQEYADKIESLIESQQIVPPPEGYFSDLLHDRILAAVQGLGHSRVWVGDDFCTERKLHWIEDLKASDRKSAAGRCNIFTPDKGLLWTNHWDSHFSFLCSSKSNLAKIQEAGRFEGFFCTPSTEVFWSVRPEPT